MTKRQRAYHHGDLRQQCLAHGLELLSSGGPEAVSLREVARVCRVSPRAPYQHFADKTAFLAALAEVGFEKFGAALQQAAKKGGAPHARLMAAASAYLKFAAEHPQLMRLMFGNDFSRRRERFPALDAAALATFGMLQGELARVSPRAPARSHRLAAASAWAMVHGLSELARSGQLEHVLPNASERRALLGGAVGLFTRR